MIHTIDKAKVELELNRRGWKRSRYHDWLIPDLASFATMEEDWTQAILAGIVCEHEQNQYKHKKFLRNYRDDDDDL